MLDLIAGSYTESRPGRDAGGEGISLLRFDPETGALATIDVAGSLLNPSYVRVHGGIIQTVIETPQATAGLASLAVRGDRLQVLGRAKVPGDGPCHIDVHADGGFLAVACYGSGHVSIHRLDRHGVAGPADAVVLHAGSGPNAARQAGPHAHAVCFAPDGRTLLVADLGTDEIWCHGFDPATGVLQAEAARWQAPPGSGPRMLLFDSAGAHVVLLTELGNSVHLLAWRDGGLQEVHSAATLPPGWSGTSTAAGLRWHPSGRLFAVSNRGADSLALFEVDGGRLRRCADIAAGGPKPRDFEFSPCGRWLLAASQDGDAITVFAVDAASGRLTDTGLRHRISTPSCLRFLPAQEPASP